MNKEEFEKKILELLKEAGYNIEGIQYFDISCSVGEVPGINISYFKI